MLAERGRRGESLAPQRRDLAAGHLGGGPIVQRRPVSGHANARLCPTRRIGCPMPATPPANRGLGRYVLWEISVAGLRVRLGGGLPHVFWTRIEPCLTNERRASNGSPALKGPVHVGRSSTMQRPIGALPRHRSGAMPAGGRSRKGIAFPIRARLLRFRFVVDTMERKGAWSVKSLEPLAIGHGRLRESAGDC